MQQTIPSNRQMAETMRASQQKRAHEQQLTRQKNVQREVTEQDYYKFLDSLPTKSVYQALMDYFQDYRDNLETLYEQEEFDSVFDNRDFQRAIFNSLKTKGFEQTMASLEQASASADFKQFIPDDDDDDYAGLSLDPDELF